MPWVPGSYAAFDDSAFVRAAHWVDSLQLGGIIISGGSPADIAIKLNHLQRRSALPLLIAADLEGGSAFRFNGGTPFPTNMGIAAGGTELDAYGVGRITALEGRAVGVHMAFAPVADVNNNPANPIINTRSFGEDPARVAALVSATVRGIQEHGMLATVKHFPGHGDTGTDSHISLPVILSDWTRLDSIELVPFRAAVRAGVGAVMSAHIALPGIDSGNTRAASLSPAIVTGVLRDSLGFRGIVVTDALTMGGVSTDGGASAAVRALLAGADLLLQPADPRAALDSLEQAYRDGRITDERIDRSLRRVLQLKEQLDLFRRRTVDVEAIPNTVGRQEFRNQGADLMRRAIVLARDAGGTVDTLRHAAQRSVTLITCGDEKLELGRQHAHQRTPRPGVPGGDLQALGRERGGELRFGARDAGAERRAGVRGVGAHQLRPWHPCPPRRLRRPGGQRLQTPPHRPHLPRFPVYRAAGPRGGELYRGVDTEYADGAGGGPGPGGHRPDLGTAADLDPA